MSRKKKQEIFPKHDTKDIVNVLEYAMDLHLRKTQVDEREWLQIKFGNPAKTYHMADVKDQVYADTELFYTKALKPED